MEIITAHKTTAKLDRWHDIQQTIPYNFGMQDALNGELCVGEMYFTHKSDLAQYAAGWESVRGQSLLSRSYINATQACVASKAEDK